MKPLITLFAILLLHLSALAQDTTWYNQQWEATTAAKASYFRTKIRTDTGWFVTDHYRSGKPQMTGSYADDSFHIRQGEFRWYDGQGNIDHLVTFAKGKENGPETFYYNDGRKKATGNNKDDKHEGPWFGYYHSGKIAGKAFYKAGQQASASFFNENGSPNKKDTAFLRGSDYPGGIPQYLRFLNKTLRYPDSAVIYEREGTVVVQFRISPEGKISDLQVVQSVSKELDDEALRVMRSMPDWIPAVIGGIPSESYQKQPVVFKLN